MAMVPQYLDMWKQAVDPEFREANRSCYWDVLLVLDVTGVL